MPVSAVIMLLLGCLLAALATTLPTNAVEPVRIGVTLGLTGKYGQLGEMQHRAYMLWQHHINEDGGILGRPVKLIIFDDEKVALHYGATIDKYIGDAIMIFFGDPQSRGVKEDALACVKMALAMRRRLAELNTAWRNSGIEASLVTRVGIHTGFCTVGNFGSEERMDYTIIGGAVNRASRLEHEAPAGEIIISFETYSLIKDEIHCEEVGKIRVRGIAYPIATYKVIDRYENLSADARPVHVELPNLTLDVAPLHMAAKERSEAAQALKDVLNRLENSAEIPSTSTDTDHHDKTTPRPSSMSRPRGKLGKVLSALDSPNGATLEELAIATGWQPRTVAGALSKLRKNGFDIELRETGQRNAYYKVKDNSE